VHVVIMGCGRVGSSLALSLEHLGHSVSVIDQESGAFRRLPESFSGTTVTGVGFDRDTLVEAGIEKAASFAAVSSGDNSNIISARVARETFNVEHVVARIYDPKRAAVYQRLGIPTVATVRWTADQMLRLLLPEGAAPTWTDPSGKVLLAEIPVPKSWAGRKVTELEESAKARVVLLTRNGEGQLPAAQTVVQEGDFFHFTVLKADAEAVDARIAEGPRSGKGH
jgi:trk system potassium uptake protein TrkA